jgi:hypothetical protein
MSSPVAPPQHFLYFFPDRQGQGSFRPTLAAFRSEPENPRKSPPPSYQQHPPIKENMPTTGEALHSPLFLAGMTIWVAFKK